MKRTWKQIITLTLAAVMTLESGVAEVFGTAIDSALTGQSIITGRTCRVTSLVS